MTIGLFPLNLVLFPWAQLPLHIYEPRYRQLISECLADGRAFGINLVEGTHMHTIGCAARVTQVTQRHPDGRMDIVVQGTTRFRVLDVRQDAAPYLVGEIETIDDEDVPTDPLLVERCAGLFNQIIDLVYGADGPHFDPQARPDVSAAYLMAPKAGMDLDQKQRMLDMTTENERLEFLLDHLQEIVPTVKRAELTQRIIMNDGYLPPEDGA